MAKQANAGSTRRVLVTGASSGIGAETVRRLTADGMRVVAAARRQALLEDLAAETGCEPYPLDVTSDEQVDALAAWLRDSGGLDAVVNNAGGALGLDAVEDADIAGWRRMYELNVLGTLRVTKAVLPLIRAAGGGDILNVTSTAAHAPYEGGSGYTGVKHAERMLTTTLRLEIVGEPIRVIEISPGNVETDFSRVRFFGDEERAAKVYAGYEPLRPEDIADVISFALTRPSRVNLDLVIVRPRDQASNTKIARRTDS